MLGHHVSLHVRSSTQASGVPDVVDGSLVAAIPLASCQYLAVQSCCQAASLGFSRLSAPAVAGTVGPEKEVVIKSR